MYSAARAAHWKPARRAMYMVLYAVRAPLYIASSVYVRFRRNALWRLRLSRIRL